MTALLDLIDRLIAPIADPLWAAFARLVIPTARDAFDVFEETD